MDLLSATMDYFDESGIALADKFAPYYCSSVACHMLNLENQEREFMMEQGRVANLRMHIFMCAPPGFMKSLTLSSFLDGRRSILGKTTVGTAYEGFMTEAGYTGTMQNIDGKTKTTKGAAYEHRESILGIDEFAVIGNLMQTDYGKSLDTALLTSLDRGLLVKRLAAGKIQYTTQLTLWTGSQPERFDLSSGLGRRLFFIYFIPSQEEEGIITDARRAKGSYIPDQIFENIKESINNLKANISVVEDITIDRSIYDFFDAHDVPHYEEIPYERLAIGHTFASNEHLPEQVTIEMNDDLEQLFRNEFMWRKQIKRGPELSQVVKLLSDRGAMKVSQLKDKMTDFGLSYEQATRTVRDLLKQGILKVQKTKGGKGRSGKVVMISEEYKE